MATVTRGLSRIGSFLAELGGKPNQLGGYQANALIQFYIATQGQEDVVPKLTGMTLYNGELGFLRTFAVDRWGSHVLFSPPPNDADALVYNLQSGLWVPTAQDRPVVSQLQVYDDATNVVEVKRFYSGLTHSPAAGNGTLKPVGAHTLGGNTNKSYRVVIDSSGTQSWNTATFRWSDDGGASYMAGGTSVATGAASGRKALARIALSNGVQVLFSEGTYAAGDQWAFTVIAAGNQLYDLTVDTTNSRVQVGKSLEVVDAEFKLEFTGSNPAIFWGYGGTSQLVYIRSTNELQWIDAAYGFTIHAVSPATGGGVRIVDLPLRFRSISTPLTNASEPQLYTKSATYHPYWLDTAGLESDLLDRIAASLGTAKGQILVYNGTAWVTLAPSATLNDMIYYDSSTATGLKTGAPPSGTVVFATPAIALGSAAAAGSGSNVIRHNSTIAAFDTTAPGSIGIGDTASVGTVNFALRRDAKFAFPAPAAAYPQDVVQTEADGTATTPARSDVKHSLAVGNDLFWVNTSQVATASGGVQLAAWVQGANIASAGNLALGTDGNFFMVTGTTTINTITSKPAGYLLKLHFNSTLKLTHNVAGTGLSLLLVGSVSWTPRAGTFVELISDGANWREISQRPYVRHTYEWDTPLPGLNQDWLPQAGIQVLTSDDGLAGGPTAEKFYWEVRCALGGATATTVQLQRAPDQVSARVPVATLILPANLAAPTRVHSSAIDTLPTDDYLWTVTTGLGIQPPTQMHSQLETREYGR